MSFSSWIGDRHRDGFQARAVAGPDGHPIAWVIEDLLRPERLRGLAALYASDARWQDTWGLYRKGEKRCGQAEWQAAPTERRFYHFLEFAGPAEGHPVSIGMAHLVGFKAFLLSAPCHAALQALTGRVPARTATLAPHVMEAGHSLGLHDDSAHGAPLCAAFYVGEGWQDGHGGEFELTSGGKSLAVLPPRQNCMLLFDPMAPQQHRVMPVTAPEWHRCSITVWWSADKEPGFHP